MPSHRIALLLHLAKMMFFGGWCKLWHWRKKWGSEFWGGWCKLSHGGWGGGGVGNVRCCLQTRWYSSVDDAHCNIGNKGDVLQEMIQIQIVTRGLGGLLTFVVDSKRRWLQTTILFGGWCIFKTRVIPLAGGGGCLLTFVVDCKLQTKMIANDNSFRGMMIFKTRVIALAGNQNKVLEKTAAALKLLWLRML